MVGPKQKKMTMSEKANAKHETHPLHRAQRSHFTTPVQCTNIYTFISSTLTTGNEQAIGGKKPVPPYIHYYLQRMHGDRHGEKVKVNVEDLKKLSDDWMKLPES